MCYVLLSHGLRNAKYFLMAVYFSLYCNVACIGVDIFEESEILNSLTVEDANALLRELMKESNMTCSLVIPSEE